MDNMNSLTDDQLALLYMKGNNNAFDELLERNKSKLFSYIMLLVGDASLADDIFQDTFVKAIVKLQEGKYKPIGKFSFWLMCIARNAAFDHFRKKIRHKEYGENKTAAGLSNTAFIASCREDEIVNGQVLDDVRRMMDWLPDTQREVLYMRFYQGLSFREIAKITNVSINTALGRVRYALINMRKIAKEKGISLQFA